MNKTAVKIGVCEECADSIYSTDEFYTGFGCAWFCSERCVMDFFDISWSKDGNYLTSDGTELEYFDELLEFLGLEKEIGANFLEYADEEEPE